jgi:hypothetical protein
MANYLLVYHGGSQPEDEAAGKAVMDAWMGWFGRLGSAVVDGGNPTSQTKVISSDGSVADGGPQSPTGYSVLRAESLDEAVALAKGCPHLAAGGMVEVSETIDAM